MNWAAAGNAFESTQLLEPLSVVAAVDGTWSTPIPDPPEGFVGTRTTMLGTTVEATCLLGPGRTFDYEAQSFLQDVIDAEPAYPIVGTLTMTG